MSFLTETHSGVNVNPGKRAGDLLRNVYSLECVGREFLVPNLNFIIHTVINQLFTNHELLTHISQFVNNC